jgi:hypothetical protein
MRAAAQEFSAGRNFAVVRVAEAANLCRLQAATREMGRSAGLSEARVFEAVIAVTELAHRLFIEASACGDVELAAVRFRGGMGLDVRAASALEGGPRPSVSARLSFPPAAGGASRARRTQ